MPGKPDRKTAKKTGRTAAKPKPGRRTSSKRAPPARKAGGKKPSRQAGKAAPKPAANPTKPNAVRERRHCAAIDPFGDPCQSVPRLASQYCTIHSYLDR